MPVRFLAESLGLDVSWDKVSNTVYINGSLPEGFEIISGI